MDQQTHNILIVDDDFTVREMISEGLREYFSRVISTETPEEALVQVKGMQLDFALLDLDLGWNHLTGIELGLKLQEIYPDLIVIIMTGYHNLKFAVDAMRNYMFHYMIKPFRIDQIVSLTERSERERSLRKENKNLYEQIDLLKAENQRLKNVIREIRPEEAELALSLKEREMKKRVKNPDALASYQKQKESPERNS